ncbi:hypothetical protein [Paenibacillus polymyxa]|uniref:Uncharacterized protein n=1 Tax=Paenibacillus polymyxa (strain SC2) TaxID=886882 RepID=E3EK05_PAEPS|nr:hypothetical protein [Paenibacillus polymyxa]ADO59714.1 hypothetical protein PPSC2_26590 [Paenibacillus polymyxa SC2]WPQ59468.1 hypothetical protein SKN87_27790 [Paenibacillus polymyxa]
MSRNFPSIIAGPVKKRNACVIGKTITSAVLGYADRDDEVYLICKLNNEDRFHFEIPMGFDPEDLELDSFAHKLITEDEFNAFID